MQKFLRIALAVAALGILSGFRAAEPVQPYHCHYYMPQNAEQVIPGYI